MKNRLTEISLYFGVDTQITKLKEEMNEFIDAINEFENYCMDDEVEFDNKVNFKMKEHICEEAADVLNIVEGLIGAIDIKDELSNAMRNYKMIRTETRNEGKYYENF